MWNNQCSFKIYLEEQPNMITQTNSLKSFFPEINIASKLNF